MTVTTTLHDRHGGCRTHVGSDGFTVTARQNGDRVDVDLDFDIEEKILPSVIGILLERLERTHDAAFLQQCLAHYAVKAGKFFVVNDKDGLIMIQERKETP